MSDQDSASPQPTNTPPAMDVDTRTKLRDQIFGNLFDSLKPWLVEFGNWIFGGLIAFNLVVAAALLTVGPAHLAVQISVALFACALPLDVSGLFLLRLITDMKDISIDDMMRQAFENANIPNPETRFPADQNKGEELSKKRTDLGLRYSIRLAAASIVLTLLGIVAALVYMAWWIAAIFIIVVAICVLLCTNLVPRLVRPDVNQQEMRARYQAQKKAKS